MKHSILVLVALLSFCGRGGAAANKSGTEISRGAYPVPDKNPPPAGERERDQEACGKASKSYTQTQIDDQLNPPDWYPPGTRRAGRELWSNGFQVQACGSCHLMSGPWPSRSPATLAGLPVAYLMRQMADFKSGAPQGSDGV